MTRSARLLCVARAPRARRAAGARRGHADPAAVGAHVADAGAAARGVERRRREVLFPPGMTSDQRVLVGIDTTGKPVSVARRPAARRCTKLGDYSFAVPGPIVDVEAAPGSRVGAGPAARRDPLVRLLVRARRRSPRARRCAPGAASSRLPLRALDRARRRRARRSRARTRRPRAAPVLVGAALGAGGREGARRDAQDVPLGASAPDLYAKVPRTPLSQSEPIVGAARRPRRARRQALRTTPSATAGRSTFELRVPHAPANAKLQLVVTPVPPRRLLTPPGARRGRGVRRGRVPHARLLEPCRA